jgi:hypothetical protein
VSLIVIRGKYISAAHYCLFIGETEVVVQSREFEVFKTDKFGEMVEAPETKNPLCQ